MERDLYVMGQVIEFTKLEVGNGARVLTDLWADDECLKQRFPLFFSCCNNKDEVVADF